jgi:tetrahydromethanopterin S-methyltransferase subunit B
MPDNEFMSIKEAIREVSNKVDDIHESVNSLRVEIADKYVKKEDFEKVQSENNDVHKTLYGWLIGLLVAVIGGVIGIISNLLK